MGRLIVMMLPLLGVSCAGEGPVATDASYDLTCPDPPASCSLPQSNCLGNGGLREILGVNGEVSCDGETPLIAICELQRFEGGQLLTLVASVGDEFAFELRGVAVESDGSVSGAACAVTIIEDQVSYGGRLGACGDAQPSMEQPCQISNVVLGDADGADISFDVACQGLLSDTTGNSYNVGGREGGPARIRFARCTSF